MMPLEKKSIFQDESDFLLQIPINKIIVSINSQNNGVHFKGQRKDVPNKSPFHQTNRQSVKVMV